LALAVDGLRVEGGGDSPEAKYEALIEMAGNSRAIGFRSEARSFVVLVTDAVPHVAGDWPQVPPSLTHLGRNPALAVRFSQKAEDGIADGDPLNEDYPSAQQVIDALSAANLSPIFLVSGNSIRIYESFVKQFGRGVTLPISSDSSNLLEVLFAGIRRACADPGATAK
jgi:hypothetical protein